MSVMSIKDIVMYSLFAISFMGWLFLFVKSKKYDSLFENLDKKDYPLKELYSTGYFLLELIGYKYTTKRDRKKRQELNVLYGEKYADYYLRVIYSQQISLTLLVFMLSFCMYGFSQQIAVWLVMVAFAGVAFYYFGDITSKKIRKRSEEMLSEFCEVVSELALLTNAGMILHEAWEFVANSDREGTIYDEMRIARDDMNNGLPDVEAIRRFGNSYGSTLSKILISDLSSLFTKLKKRCFSVMVKRLICLERVDIHCKRKTYLCLKIFISFLSIQIMLCTLKFISLTKRYKPVSNGVHPAVCVL